MDVWVIEKGSKYEGGSVVSVHASYQFALDTATAIMDKEFHYWEDWRIEERAAGKEISDFDAKIGIWHAEPDNTEDYSVWYETGEYVSIRKMEVGHVPSF